MINVPLKDVVLKISQKTGMPEAEVKKKISEKVDQLYGLVSEDGAAHILANEYGIKVFDISSELKIKDILAGMKSVDVTGKVVRKYELREFNTEKRKGKVANLMLSDETGSIRIVFWNDKTNDFNQIKEDDVIKIKNAYVRENMGRKELHLGDSAKVIINPENVTIKTKDVPDYDRKHIAELQDGMSAEILGTIVQVFDIKFFEVCPTCNKRMRLKNDELACDEHGKLEPAFNYVINIYLDDGTGNIRAIFWKSQTQKLLQLNDSQVLVMRLSPENFEKYKTELLGQQVKLLGKAKNNIMGRLEFNTDLVYVQLDPEAEIAMLDHAKEIALQPKKSDSYSEPKKPSAPAPASSQPKASPKPAPKNDAKPEADEESFDDEFEISEDFLDE